MLLPLLGVLAGVLLGLALRLNLPIDWARYTAVGILAALDSLLGAFRAELEGNFDTRVIVSGSTFAGSGSSRPAGGCSRPRRSSAATSSSALLRARSPRRVLLRLSAAGEGQEEIGAQVRGRERQQHEAAEHDEVVHVHPAARGEQRDDDHGRDGRDEEPRHTGITREPGGVGERVPRIATELRPRGRVRKIPDLPFAFSGRIGAQSAPTVAASRDARRRGWGA